MSRPGERVRIEVDGQVCNVVAGGTLSQALDEIAALGSRFEIPHLCWHPKLSADPVCGLCQIEVENEGESSLQAACLTPVRAGMRVRTRGAAVDLVREHALTQLLARHPRACAQCDKAGECLLQDCSFEHRFLPQPSALPQQPGGEPARTSTPIGPTLVLDPQLCIGCGLCIRFCAEVSGAAGLVLAPGSAAIEYAGDGPFDDPYSLDLVDLCPVGALASRDFRCRIRVWDLQPVEGVCSGCSRGCNLFRDVARGRVWRQRPRRNDAVNATWLCDAGRLSYHEIERPDRLRGAWLRDETGRLEPATCDEAIAEAARRLRVAVAARGGSAVVGMASAHASDEDLGVFQALLAALGSPPAGLVVPEWPADRLLRTHEAAANAAGARESGAVDGRVALRAIRAGEVAALVVLGHDLLAPGCLASEHELAALDSVIWIDWCQSPLLRVAHVVFASRHAAEKEGHYRNCDGHVQLSRQAVEPAFEAWSEADLLTRLGHALDLPGFERAGLTREGVQRPPVAAALAGTDR